MTRLQRLETPAKLTAAVLVSGAAGWWLGSITAGIFIAWGGWLYWLTLRVTHAVDHGETAVDQTVHVVRAAERAEKQLERAAEALDVIAYGGQPDPPTTPIRIGRHSKGSRS